MATYESKELEAGTDIEVAKGERYEDANIHKTTINRAKAATEKEHRMSLWVGIRTYPKAIGWSMLISLCITMEAFDLCLLNTFCIAIHTTTTEQPLTKSRWSTTIPRKVRH